jgi:cytochrome c biogenesis protein CcmG, thiol:disulfide interchange protein DsbE
MRLWRIGALAALSMATACAGSDGPPPPRLGKPATAYVAATLEGDSVSLASLRGHVVLLNMWATWCAPCRSETPYLESLFESHRSEGLRVVGVSMDAGDASAQVAAFAEKYGVTYTVLHDPQMRGLNLYQVMGLPASFLIDRNGVLRWMRYGPIQVDDSQFLQVLSGLLS